MFTNKPTAKPHQELAVLRFQESGLSVTIKDVAAAAGVSPSTVSQVLRNAGNSWVGENTRERVRQIARELGYRANPAARLLASRLGQYFAIVVRRIKSMIMQDPVRAVTACAIEAGYTPFVVESIDLPRAHYDHIESLADAVVFIGTGDKEFNTRINQFNAGVAAVVASRPAHSRFPEFIWSEVAGFDLVFDHLVGLDHTRIALLDGCDTHPNEGNLERLKNYRAACEKRNLAPLIITSGGEEKGIQTGREMACALIEHHPDITAVVARNVEFAIGALSECQRRGLRFPQDMSLVSYTDSPAADSLWPRLTALRTPILKAAECAADAVLSQLSGPSVPVGVTELPVHLITGETNGPPRMGHLSI